MGSNFALESSNLGVRMMTCTERPSRVGAMKSSNGRSERRQDEDDKLAK